MKRLSGFRVSPSAAADENLESLSTATAQGNPIGSAFLGSCIVCRRSADQVLAFQLPAYSAAWAAKFSTTPIFFSNSGGKPCRSCR